VYPDDLWLPSFILVPVDQHQIRGVITAYYVFRFFGHHLWHLVTAYGDFPFLRALPLSSGYRLSQFMVITGITRSKCFPHISSIAPTKHLSLSMITAKLEISSDPASFAQNDYR
jgi:hypothetical protein